MCTHRHIVRRHACDKCVHLELIKFYRIPKTKIAKNPSYGHMNFHGLHSTGHDLGPTTDDINKHACMLACNNPIRFI